MQGEQVAGDISHLESFLEEAGCLPSQRSKHKAFTRAETDESDFEVEEEFKSRRVAASKAGRGRGVAKGRGKGGGSKIQCRPVAEVKQNVTTQKFIEATGKAKFVEVQRQKEEDSGEETLSEGGDPQEGSREGKKKAGRNVLKFVCFNKIIHFCFE